MFIFASTDNKVKDAGATSLSEALKSNTTLTGLYLKSEDRRKKTHKRHPSANHSFYHNHTIRKQDRKSRGSTTV